MNKEIIYHVTDNKPEIRLDPAHTRQPAEASRDASSVPANDPITGFAAAEAQVAAIFGSADVVIRIRAINPLKNREERDKSVELQGTLAELRERLETLTAAGYNGYLIPQPHRPPSGTQIADADVTGINCLFADGDETDLPAEWHVPPSFILIHPTTGRWWAFWLVNKETFPLADFDPMQKRIAANYGSDPRVCNPGRIVRLAGFDRWKKGENFGPYDFFAGTMDTTDHFQHLRLPALSGVSSPKSTDGVIDWDNARAHANNERAPELDAVIIPWDLPENVALAIEWLNAEAQVAVLGSQGNNTAYATAAKMCSLGLSQKKAFEVLLKHWAPKCEPAWTNDVDPRNEKKLRDIVANAYYYNKKPPAGHTPAYHAAKLGFKPVEGAESEPAAANGELAKPDWLFNGPAFANQPQPQWIIPGILAKGDYSIASGRSQAGKSFCELALALSVATGEPWLGEPVKITGPSFVVVAEGQPRLWPDVEAWCAVHGVKPESLQDKFFIINRAARLNRPEGQKMLDEALRYIEQTTGRLPTYGHFDTLRGNMTGSVSDEKDAGAVLEEVSKLQARGIAVTLIAHHGRGHDETKGCTEWEDGADAVRRYDGTVRGRDTKIKLAKVKAAEDGWSIAVTYRQPDGHATLVAAGGTVEGRSDAPAAGANPAEAAQTRAEGSKHDPKRNNNPFTLAMIDKELAKILKSNPTHPWSASELADALEGCPNIDLSANTLRKTQLPKLKADKVMHAHRCYLRDTTKRWKWKEPDGSHWNASEAA